MKAWNKLVEFLIIAVGTVALCALWFRAVDAAPTHVDCVAYWMQRTATWDNAPCSGQINNDSAYCGEVR